MLWAGWDKPYTQKGSWPRLASKKYPPYFAKLFFSEVWGRFNAHCIRMCGKNVELRFMLFSHENTGNYMMPGAMI